MEPIEVYTFERGDGTTLDHATQDPREAEAYARERGVRVVANRFEWCDSEPVSEWDFTPAAQCTCVGSCPADWSDNPCEVCRALDPYQSCPVVGFGCGPGCECCTSEQQAAVSAGAGA